MEILRIFQLLLNCALLHESFLVDHKSRVFFPHLGNSVIRYSVCCITIISLEFLFYFDHNYKRVKFCLLWRS